MNKTDRSAGKLDKITSHTREVLREVLSSGS